MSGAEKRGLPSALFAGTSCIVTRPVRPVDTMSTASSSGDSGAGALVLVWLIGPDEIEVPRATLRVRRSVIAAIRGYENRLRNPGCDEPGAPDGSSAMTNLRLRGVRTVPECVCGVDVSRHGDQRTRFSPDRMAVFASLALSRHPG